MIKKLLIRKAKKEEIDNKQRILEAEKIYFIEDTSKDYHCSDGVFSKDDLQKIAVTIKSNKGKEFYILDASFIDSFKGIKKTAQTIPLKDLGFILAETGIGKDSIIADAGTGSGGAACFLARHVKKVYSFDINQKNIEQAQANAEYFDIKNIEFNNTDVYKEIPIKNVDLLLLDLPEPWKAIDAANIAITHGGFIVIYCPQITQIQQFINEIMKKNYLHIKTVEVIERDWKVDGEIVRPKSLSNIHSGFISIVRKIS
jgi:tRNA (adenine57-N1/adenine58-N1)-methyltransferase